MLFWDREGTGERFYYTNLSYKLSELGINVIVNRIIGQKVELHSFIAIYGFSVPVESPEESGGHQARCICRPSHPARLVPPGILVWDILRRQ